jgi:hypothetical protein
MIDGLETAELRVGPRPCKASYAYRSKYSMVVDNDLLETVHGYKEGILQPLPQRLPFGIVGIMLRQT